MGRTFQRVELLWCFFLTVTSQTAKILPPRNFSMEWTDDFNQKLSWEPPQQSMTNCWYELISDSGDKVYDITHDVNKLQHQKYIVMGGGSLQWSVSTKCGEKEWSQESAQESAQSSKPVFLRVAYPNLVTNLQCFIHTAQLTRCSWIHTSETTDLRFFFRLVTEGRDSPALALTECPWYTETDGLRTGCDLTAEVTHAVHIVFNGTHNHTFARNTFRKTLLHSVRPPPLKWNVTKTKDEFNIDWIPPDIVRQRLWKFVINYTECGETRLLEIQGQTQTTLPIAPHCLYRMAIKATSRAGETPWSDEKRFDADTDANAWVYAAIIVPFAVAGLVALTLVCCRKNRKTLFPDVPQPRDLLSDISDNNNKSNILNLYVPAEEEDNCKITLVTDPQINRLSS